MNEKDIGAALARLEALRGTDGDRRLARNILQRDRTRVWLLTGLAVLFWGIAAAAVFFVIYVAMFHLYPKQQQLMHQHAIGKLPAEQFVEIQASHFHAIELCTLVVAAAFIAGTLAAICTWLLVHISRRATLSQINANLIEIFEQLQQQRPGSVSADPGSGKTARE